jgi:Domain of unknown function (DUF4157)
VEVAVDRAQRISAPAPLVATVTRQESTRGVVQRTAQIESLPSRAALPVSALRTLQPKLEIGAANDPFEREADATADAVMSKDASPRIGIGSIAASLMRFVRRAVGKTEPPAKKDEDERKKVVQKDSARMGGEPSMVPAGIESSIDSMSASGGAPLHGGVRALFEPRFGYDFSDVRVHTGEGASGAAMALGARAFTVGDHIFFGRGEYQPASPQGQRLIAHELTHTIQQKPAAARASRTLARAPALPVSSVGTQAAPKRVQRLLDDIKASIRGKVREFIVRDFPPWDLITLVIGWDPIQDKTVKGATRDWIRAAMKLAPDGEALFARLDQEGKIDAIAKWWDGEVAKLDLTYNSIVALANRAWEAASAGDVFNPSNAWNEKFKPIFEPTIKRVWAFIKEVGSKVLAVIKEVVLGSLAAWAREQKGYPLLTFILGKDPVTGDEVKRTAKGLIFAVLDLVPGGEPIKENLEKSKTIEKAAAWFSQEVKQLDLTWDGIKALFKQAWDAFKVADLLNPKLLFEKMWGIFGPPVMRLLKFLLAVAKKILELIFEGAMLIAGPIGLQIAGIVKKAGAAFDTIVKDPVAFVGHLVDAVKKGIQQFAKNIWDHLKTGLIEWLVGTLEGAGLVLPKVWDLKGILDLVLQILGISYAKVRAKLVKVVGEKTVATLEKVFAFVKTLVTEGPAAAWKEIVAAIGSLWDMVIGGIKDWAVTKIVTAAITKLVTMFNPAGAVIQAIIATYNTIAFFIERIKQILAFVESVVDSIANIATGKVAAAATYVERAMARTIPVILGFLARLIGLGNVSDAVKKVITAIQEKVDKAIDAVIKWIVDKAKALVAPAKGEAPAPAEPGKVLSPEEASKVKAAALIEVDGKIRGGKFRHVSELQKAIDATYTKHRPAGLKSLSIRVTDEATLAFAVVARASDPEQRTIRWDEAFAADDEAKLLFMTQPRYETNAALSINGQRFGETSASTDEGHAEQNLIAAHWKKALEVLESNRAKGIRSTVVVAINRAPCHTRCTAALVTAIESVPANVRANTTFILAPTGTYEPTENLDEAELAAAEERYKEVNKTIRSAGGDVEGYTVVSKAKLTVHTTRMSDLALLSSKGWDLRQLAVRPKPTAAGVILAEAAHKLAVQAGRIKAGSE